MKVSAYAKLNLNLDILGNCGNFHQLRSNVTTIDICDTVEVVARRDNLVLVSGMPDVDMYSNIAYRAGILMVQRCNTPGVDIAIAKGIPMSSGMGGSSADGAGVLVAMCRLFGIDILDSRVLGIANDIGSDVSYLMVGGCAVIAGKGDDIEMLPYVQRYFVVTTFETRLDTGDVFRLYDSSSRVICANALQGAVEQHYHYMDGYKQLVASMGHSCSMTGSGSAYFVQCSSVAVADRLAEKLVSHSYNSIPCSSINHGVVIVDD